MQARWAVALILLAIAGAADAQYRWRDPSGQVSYGDIPPTDSRDVQPVNPRVPVARTDGNTTLPFELRRATAHHPAVLYTSSDCTPCDNARAFLRQRGIPFSERTIEAPEDVETLRRLTGVDKVPVLTLGRERLCRVQRRRVESRSRLRPAIRPSRDCRRATPPSLRSR